MSAPRGRAPRLRVLIVTALGLALAVYLLRHIGFRAVFAAAASVGWGGFALLCGYAFVVFGILGPAWYVLMPRANRLSPLVFICARMVRDAASEALPFSQIGGMILGVRAASVLGVPRRLAVASAIVDVTTELLGQLLYMAVGLFILNARAAQMPLAHALVRTSLIGLAASTLAGVLFLALQRQGLSWLSDRLALRMLPGSAGYAAAIATLLREMYRAPLRIVLSVLLHFCGWIAGAVGTWIAFRLIGVHVDVAAVIAIESLVYAARSLTFFIPNALGVQEAAYALLAPLFGVGKEFALAISLLKRARDIAIGIPILLAWQMVEGHRALALQRRGAEHKRLDTEG
ncbi:MAG TPA: lysylphosphatidylglycerol synthase domain-containing protein [Steroidobacteraceae bacterium]|jgi:putative membrane protein|nr:lysylphosphatidylglycerol synthase domain-containing protein [Steroidobacteraceae bacterium]